MIFLNLIRSSFVWIAGNLVQFLILLPLLWIIKPKLFLVMTVGWTNTNWRKWCVKAWHDYYENLKKFYDNYLADDYPWDRPVGWDS